MPWTVIFRPSLGLSLLKANLGARGIPADVRYFNLLWARQLFDHCTGLINEINAGQHEHSMQINALLFQRCHSAGMVEEWLFASHLFGPKLSNAQQYVDAVLKEDFSPTDLKICLSLLDLVPPFLERCLKSVDWNQYTCVGFTSTFRQSLASLALAKLIKQNFPHIKIVMGGPNCEGEMGRAMLRLFDCLDYVISGEGDESFPALLKCMETGSTPQGINGVIWRQNGVPVSTFERAVVKDLDALPFPDFSDYFQQLRQFSFTSLDIRVPIEQSRGCWWGMRHQCTFCGLNGKGIEFRTKSPQRALEELFDVGKRHNVTQIEFTDNILSMKYFDTLLPQLAGIRHPFSLFYEVKANLRKEQLKLLRRAGVRTIQPGIESLSSHVLKLMGKGTSPLQNIQCLKWCAQYGIRAEWNLLYGFPGETAEDYRQMLQVVQAITHLPPPNIMPRIRMDRFSPNFEKARKMGFVKVRPQRPYFFLFPFPEQDVSELAYFFDYEYEAGSAPEEYASEVKNLAKKWKDRYEKGALEYINLGPEGALIRDRRFNLPAADFKLTPLENRIYLFCDEAQSLERIKAEVAQATAEVQEILDQFVERKLMVSESGRYLSLAPVEDRAPVAKLCPCGFGSQTLDPSSAVAQYSVLDLY